jgi:outer membrane protein assembly factor BamB
MVLKLLVGSVILAMGATVVPAENWPGWRGPRGDGTSAEKDVPLNWSATSNVLWKTALNGQGHSSPIVWGNHLFLTTAVTDTEERVLLCLDRKSGQILWQQTVLRVPLEAKAAENSFASATPTTDGKQVYVTFLDAKDVVVAAYDFSGKQAWVSRPGQFYSQHGFSHSPTLFDDKVLVVCDSKAENFIVALDRADGHVLWKVQRDKPTQSYSPPLIRELAGRRQMIVSGNCAVTSYDPRTGQKLWVVDGPSEDTVVTPVYNEKAGLLLTSSSWPKRILLAIRPDGEGNVTETNIAWSSAEGGPYVPSPISVGDWFLTSGFATKEVFCFEAANGTILWHEKIASQHASPVVANGCVYFLSDDGVMNVVRAGPKFELVARNELGEKTYASPAISDGQLFLRGFKNLYCIGGSSSEVTR